MESASTLTLVLRLGFGLLVVMGAMFIASGLLKRRGIGASAKAADVPKIDVVARRGLGKHAAVTVVRTGGRELVLGVTDQHVTLLRESVIPMTERIAIDLEKEAAAFAAAEKIDDAGSQRTALPDGGQQQFATPSQAWKAMLENLRERSVRR